MIATRLILIIALINIATSAVINFDPDAETLDIDIIEKKETIHCENTEESINLEDNQLKKLEIGFIKSSTIKSISLKNNEIRDMPNGVFDHVPNLECLDLTNNKIPTSQLLNLKHDGLKTLILDDQKQMLPPKWNISTNDVSLNTSEINLPNVETLSLRGIGFDKLRFYSNLFPSVSTIFFVNNHLKYVNSDFVEFFSHHLRSIHFEQNDLSDVHLNDLNNVEELYLDDNPLDRLVIEDHQNLKILSLANCHLGVEWYFSLYDIVTLDLSGNQLNESIIADKFSDVLNLENLSLSRNKFTIVPSLNNLPRLQKLSLSYNLIETINVTIEARSLKSLDLRGNRIYHIDPFAFSEVPMLEELDLSNNQLQVLDYRWGENLNMLRSLNVQSNKFQTISHINIHSLRNIKDVYVGENDFRTIRSYEIQFLLDNCTVYVV